MTTLVVLVLVALSVGALLAVITQPFVRAGAPLDGPGAAPERLEAHVRALAEELPPRSDDPKALNASADYILRQLSRHGPAVFQPFQVAGVEYRNVSLRLGDGDGPPVIVGAHYDAFAGFPGADDNASGVAGLLELARLLSHRAPPGPVELVAFALEEPPYFASGDMGSQHHAAASAAGPTPARLAIVLEMIGYFRDEPGSQTYPLPGLGALYSDRGDFIALIGRLQEVGAVRRMKSAFRGASAVPVHSLTFVPIVPGVNLSDHRSYWLEGIPAVMVTDTAYQRNPNYHTPTDTPDTLDYRRMAEVVNGLYASLLELAGGAAR